MYHCASQCLSGSASGLMVVFGGISAEKTILNDTWGLRIHRKGNWDWVQAPNKSEQVKPVARYYFTALFVSSTMVVLGGKGYGLYELLPFQTYDTLSCVWASYPPITRFRHASWWMNGHIYVHGGLDRDTPKVPKSTMFKFPISIHGVPLQKQEKKDFLPVIIHFSSPDNSPSPSPIRVDYVEKRKNEEKEFRLAGEVQIAVNFTIEPSSIPTTNSPSSVRKVPIENLQEESKRVGTKVNVHISYQPGDNISSFFIDILLKPKEFSSALPEYSLNFRREHIVELVNESQKVFKSQPNIFVGIQTPVKIFGNLHGNFTDLMRFFYSNKSPIENSQGGDIDSFAYIFLGNYIDRGARSLETICLLLALKIKYPNQIILLRGNHEEKAINLTYGLGEECKKRLNEDINHPDSVFQALNTLFSWMPVAAVIEDRIFCVHAGIGPNIASLGDLEKIKRPIEIIIGGGSQEQKILIDCLWSDPTNLNTEKGYSPNLKRKDKQIVSFGFDKLECFLKNNNLELLVRSHENVEKGFENIYGGKLLTFTSCTNYCGAYKNKACFLIVKKTMEIVPKILNSDEEISCWNTDENDLKKRPPTPPRQSQIK